MTKVKPRTLGVLTIVKVQMTQYTEFSQLCPNTFYSKKCNYFSNSKFW